MKTFSDDDDDEEAELRTLEEEGLNIDKDVLEFNIKGSIDGDGGGNADDDELDINADAFNEDEIAAIIEDVQRMHTLSLSDQRFAQFAVTKVCTSSIVVIAMMH